MSLRTIIAEAQQILSRDDVSDDQMQIFVQQGIARIQRECRLPSMERSVIITPAEAMQFMPVPRDLIQIIDVIATDPTGTYSYPLEHVAYRSLVRELSAANSPAMAVRYARQQAQLWFAGPAPPGVPLTLLYFGNFSPFAGLDGENELSASTPDLAVYAALRYAGDSVEHPSTDRWEATYRDIRETVKQMAADLENEGGINFVRPLYLED